MNVCIKWMECGELINTKAGILSVLLYEKMTPFALHCSNSPCCWLM